MRAITWQVGPCMRYMFIPPNLGFPIPIRIPMPVPIPPALLLPRARAHTLVARAMAAAAVTDYPPPAHQHPLRHSHTTQSVGARKPRAQTVSKAYLDHPVDCGSSLTRIPASHPQRPQQALGGVHTDGAAEAVLQYIAVQYISVVQCCGGHGVNLSAWRPAMGGKSRQGCLGRAMPTHPPTCTPRHPM